MQPEGREFGRGKTLGHRFKHFKTFLAQNRAVRRFIFDILCYILNSEVHCFVCLRCERFREWCEAETRGMSGDGAVREPRSSAYTDSSASSSPPMASPARFFMR